MNEKEAKKKLNHKKLVLKGKNFNTANSEVYKLKSYVKDLIVKIIKYL
jgi:hypothetical protein